MTTPTDAALDDLSRVIRDLRLAMELPPDHPERIRAVAVKAEALAAIEAVVTHPHTCQDCGDNRTCTEDDAAWKFQRCYGCYVKWGTE